MTTIESPPLISLHNVTHHYGPTPVLSAVDLTVNPDQFTGIVGPSGSGKTTLLRILLAGLEPTSGTVQRQPGLKIGYVPQVEIVNWSFPVTVAETVVMAKTPRRFPPWTNKTERRTAMTVLDRLGIADLAHRHIRELSGGQQQRVFIARALISQPQLLLMDEPTSGVDVRTRHEILHLLEDLNDDGLAIVLTTHDLNGLAAHLPHLICLNIAIQGQGPPHTVLTPTILERTYGAPMDVLQHAGMPLVIDHTTRTTPRLRSIQCTS